MKKQNTMRNTDNRTTKIYGYYQERKRGAEQVEFDGVEVPYCNSFRTAEVKAAEYFKLDPKKYNVTVLDFENESAPRFRYDFPSLVQCAYKVFEDESEAAEYITPESGFVCVTVPQYVYSAQLWVVALDSEGNPTKEYSTFEFDCESYNKMSRGNARSYLINEYVEQNEHDRVLGYYDGHRDVKQVFAIVTSEQALTCRKIVEADEEETDEL